MGRRFRMFAAVAAMSVAGGMACAQSFPSRPVRIFVPYPAGGAVDILTRTLGDAVSRQWGQGIVVENRPGAGGVIASAGARYLTAGRIHPDRGRQRPSHQLVPVPQTALRHLQGFYADFAVGLVAEHPAGARRFAIQNAGRHDCRGQGEAGKPVLCPFRHGNVDASGRRTAQEPRQDRYSITIPYKGGAPAINDLLGGQVPLLDQQRAGMGRAARRPARCGRSPSPPPRVVSFLPDVPSMAETVPGYDTEVWWGLLGPAGMPPDVLAETLA